MNKVIKAFVDKQDGGRLYEPGVGNTYPREGYEPTADRIIFLRDNGYIEALENEVTETKDGIQNLNNFTKDELLALATEKGLEVTNKNTKKEIIEALEAEK